VKSKEKDENLGKLFEGKWKKVKRKLFLLLPLPSEHWKLLFLLPLASDHWKLLLLLPLATKLGSTFNSLLFLLKRRLGSLKVSLGKT